MSQMDTTITPINEAGNEGEAQPREQSAAGYLRELLNKKRSSIQAVSTKYLSADKLAKVVGAQAARVPKLLECTPASILNAVMTCAELGLAPGPLGSVYFIPYGRECQLIIGYRGMLDLARRSGQITTISAVVVRQGDDWSLSYGEGGAHFSHVPKAPTSAAIIGVWALAKFRDGGHQFDYMSKDEVDAIRRRSKASGSGPWVTDYTEMMKKTVLRRLCKLLPLTPEIEAQIALADRTEFDIDAEAVVAAAPAGTDALVQRLETARAKAAENTPGVPADEASPDTTPQGQDEAGSVPAPASTFGAEMAAATDRIRDEKKPGQGSLLPAEGPTNRPERKSRK